MEKQKVGYLIYDKIEGFYLARRGVGFSWNFRKRNAAILTEEQAYFWQHCLQNAKGRNGFSVIMVAL